MQLGVFLHFDFKDKYSNKYIFISCTLARNDKIIKQ